ncbi:MAG: polyprenyl synthetase family protein, partial [Chloroflexi bacterium]|nr:polyprenyl synthetase family protein [Chloroflexota bacterium]
LERLVPAAVAVELVHTASLIHDDVLDEASTRRGKPTVYAEAGERMALSAGDFLFSQAFATLASLGEPSALVSLSDAAVLLCLGEFEQMRTAYTPEQPVDRYIKKIGWKTGALFEVCCELGGILSGASDDEVSLLGRYGFDLGLAFQIFDDVLDLLGGAELGKPIGTDLRDGTVTLPMLYALEEIERPDELSNVIRDQNPSDAEVTEAIALIAGTGAIEKSKAEARAYVVKAMEAAGAISSPDVSAQLSVIGEFVVDRYQ